jgi:hypothetical protein
MFDVEQTQIVLLSHVEPFGRRAFFPLPRTCQVFSLCLLDDMASDKHSAGVLVNLFQPERDIPSKVLTALVLEKKR